MTKRNGTSRKKCARTKCRKAFTPVREWQKYCSIECKNIAGQERLRERAKRTTELEAEQHGSLVGGTNG